MMILIKQTVHILLFISLQSAWNLLYGTMTAEVNPKLKEMLNELHQLVHKIQVRISGPYNQNVDKTSVDRSKRWKDQM